MVLTCLSNLGFDKKIIQKGLKNIYNPGRFEWLAPNILVDTANNAENIKILAKMVDKLPNKNIVTLFGTTQVDPESAKQLAKMIPTRERILIDDFCDRSLPYSSYADEVKHTEKIHLLHEEEKIKKWLQEKEKTIVIYGSFYLIGEIMRLSRYQPFA